MLPGEFVISFFLTKRVHTDAHKHIKSIRIGEHHECRKYSKKCIRGIRQGNFSCNAFMLQESPILLQSRHVGEKLGR